MITIIEEGIRLYVNEVISVNIVGGKNTAVSKMLHLYIVPTLVILQVNGIGRYMKQIMTIMIDIEEITFLLVQYMCTLNGQNIAMVRSIETNTISQEETLGAVLTM